MSNVRYVILAVLMILLTTVSMIAWSQEAAPFTSGELDELFGTIALYPDPLLAQVLPAATFPDELAQAAQFIRLNGGSQLIDEQDWDVSVKAVSHYPSVLNTMVDNPDWTVAIGQAYVNQPDDVLKSIQRLRAKAKLLGYLSSNSQQRVYLEYGAIRIVPVQAEYIYVPQYNPTIVYVQRRSSYGSNALSFGLGLLIGAWLNRDCDWQHHRVYYHGWNGGGWISLSRPRVRLDNHYYVNNDYVNKPIYVDTRVRTRDIGAYRTNVKQNIGTFRLPGHGVKPSAQTTTGTGKGKTPQNPFAGNARTPTTKTTVGTGKGKTGRVRGGKQHTRTPKTNKKGHSSSG